MVHYQCPNCDREAQTVEELRKNGCICKIEPLVMLDPDDHQTTKNGKKQISEKKIIKKVKGKINGYFVESIIVDNEPRFLCYDLTTGIQSTQKEIETSNRKFIPIEDFECGYIPYEFTKPELDNAIKNKISKDKLLDEIKAQIDRFVVAKEIDKHLILGYLMLSYEQECINTIFFPYFVGETESGKSTITHLFRNLAYRCLYGEDIPNADVYNFLGTDEEGAGTIAEDEAQEIDKNREKIRMYKNSYSKGSGKARIITTNYSKKQVFYKTFCPKIFAGEKVPEDKGLRERLAVVNMLEGKPQANIKRLTENEKQQLLNLRKALLLFKVQNIKDDLPQFDSGLQQRDQELWEDFLGVVYGTKYYEKCRETVACYTSQRHEAIWNSLEAKIFKILKKKLGSGFEIRLEDFWVHLVHEQDDLSGTLEKETFYPHEFGTKITRNYLARLLEDKFQARRKQLYKTDENNKKHLLTVYQFKEDVIQVLSTKYNITESSQSRLVVLSGQRGGGGRLDELKADHVDHVDDLSHTNENNSYWICYTCNEKGTEVRPVSYKGPNGITADTCLKAGHNVKTLSKEEAKLERDYQKYGGLRS